jgi:hypothetical protein
MILTVASLSLAGCGEPPPKPPEPPSAAALALLKSIAEGGDAVYNAYIQSLAPDRGFRGPAIEWRYHKRYGTDRLAASPEELEIAVDLAIDYPKSTIPGAEEWVGGYYLAVCSIWALVLRGDDAGLVRLLSQVPMDVVGPDGVYLEGVLVANWERRSVDGFRVLFDAYDRAANDEVRATLAHAARRAFWQELRDVGDDSEVVARAKELFEECRESVKPNRAYLTAYTGGDFDIGDAKGMPLLVPKDGPDFVPSTMVEGR